MLPFNSVGLCLSVLFACVIVSMPIVQGRSIGRHHRHHYSHPNYYDFTDNPEYRDSYEATEKRDRLRDILNRFFEHEEQVSPFPREHRNDLRDLVSKRQKTRDIDGIDALSSSARFAARRKRHNKHGGTVSYQTHLTYQNKKIMQEQNSREVELERRKVAHSDPRLELDVKEVQNRSICNYTVESIPDTRGSRIPRDLENVRCNHIGSDCQGAGNSYCCVQTYTYIEVSYGDGYRERLKIYVGCVCANKENKEDLQLTESSLPIND